MIFRNLTLNLNQGVFMSRLYPDVGVQGSGEVGLDPDIRVCLAWHHGHQSSGGACQGASSVPCSTLPRRSSCQPRQQRLDVLL